MITLSGYGFTLKGDYIFVVPEYPDKDQVELKVARFINVSGLARKFASRKYALNLFILNTVTVQPPTLPEESDDMLMSIDEEKYSSNPFKYLKNDAFGKDNLFQGYP